MVKIAAKMPGESRRLSANLCFRWWQLYVEIHCPWLLGDFHSHCGNGDGAVFLLRWLDVYNYSSCKVNKFADNMDIATSCFNTREAHDGPPLGWKEQRSMAYDTLLQLWSLSFTNKSSDIMYSTVLQYVPPLTLQDHHEWWQPIVSGTWMYRSSTSLGCDCRVTRVSSAWEIRRSRAHQNAWLQTNWQLSGTIFPTLITPKNSSITQWKHSTSRWPLVIFCKFIRSYTLPFLG